MPVGSIVHRDAILWLWTTNAHMPRAFEVVGAWGFEHRTILTWVKQGIRLGNWLRQRTEPSSTPAIACAATGGKSRQGHHAGTTGAIKGRAAAADHSCCTRACGRPSRRHDYHQPGGSRLRG